MSKKVFYRIVLGIEKEKYCSNIKISAPHGCLELSLYVQNFTLTRIYLEKKLHSFVLYFKDELKIPDGFLIRQLIIDDTYYLCGLEYNLRSEMLNLDYYNQTYQKTITFCFYLFKGILDN